MTISDELTTTIKPGDDFYNYVNKRWLDANPIPDDKSRYAAFTQLDERVTDLLCALLETSVTDQDSQNTRLAKRFYASAMDTAAIEAAGIKPLQAKLDAIAAISDGAGVQAFITSQHAAGLGRVWSIEDDVDEKDSSRYVMRISQAGTCLPDRDYYLDDSKQFETIRAAYKTFLHDLFELLGHDNVADRVANVWRIESALASASMTAVEKRDTQAKYNPFTFAELAQRFPGFDWRTYRSALGLEVIDGLVISQPKFLSAVLDMTQSETAAAWQDYLVVQTVVPVMPMLSEAFDQLQFSFFGTVLNGTITQQKRYKRMVAATTGMFPEPAGQLYVEAHFDESAKAKISDLVDHIQTALSQRLQKLDWMSDATKQRAQQKLDTFTPLLGYPDKWRSYADLKLTANYIDNVYAANAYEFKYVVARVSGPVDRREWLMSAATVNAYYWPNTNGITFPAAILQPPFFDPDGDIAANYGGIGAVIGHEIIHGFDDEGSRYDADGNFISWWTAEDRAAFDAKAKRLVEQYDGYMVGDKHVKGELTLGENIADLGGVLIALDALQAKLAGDDQQIDGFDARQRFFMSQARIWRTNIRPELALKYVTLDPHSPEHLRVNAVVTNVDAFYEAFGVTSADQLYKTTEERVRIW